MLQDAVRLVPRWIGQFNFGNEQRVDVGYGNETVIVRPLEYLPFHGRDRDVEVDGIAQFFGADMELWRIGRFPEHERCDYQNDANDRQRNYDCTRDDGSAKFGARLGFLRRSGVGRVQSFCLEELRRASTLLASRLNTVTDAFCRPKSDRTASRHKSEVPYRSGRHNHRAFPVRCFI